MTDELTDKETRDTMAEITNKTVLYLNRLCAEKDIPPMQYTDILDTILCQGYARVVKADKDPDAFGEKVGKMIARRIAYSVKAWRAIQGLEPLEAIKAMDRLASEKLASESDGEDSEDSPSLH